MYIKSVKRKWNVNPREGGTRIEVEFFFFSRSLARPHKPKIGGGKKKNLLLTRIPLPFSSANRSFAPRNRRDMRASFSSWRRTCSSSAGGARATHAAVPSASSSSSSAAAAPSTSGEIAIFLASSSYIALRLIFRFACASLACCSMSLTHVSYFE